MINRTESRLIALERRNQAARGRLPAKPQSGPKPSQPQAARPAAQARAR